MNVVKGNVWRSYICRFWLKETSRCAFVSRHLGGGLHKSPKLQLTKFVCIHEKSRKNS